MLYAVIGESVLCVPNFFFFSLEISSKNGKLFNFGSKKVRVSLKILGMDGRKKLFVYQIINLVGLNFKRGFSGNSG